MNMFPSIAASRRRILIVDDHADSAEGLALLLRMQGHEARTVDDGIAALTLARTFHPEIILLDIGLPGMNGYEVAKRLREEHSNTLRLVAVTGYGQEEDRRLASAAGFDHLLVKPISAEALDTILVTPEAVRHPEPNVCPD